MVSLSSKSELELEFELEPKPNSKQQPPPQLPITSFPNLKFPQPYSGALTPLHTSASIPFSWEQEPGKPLPCLTLTLPSSHVKSLHLPPRLLTEATTKMTKIPSPTTVFEGPYNSLGRSILQSSSFRFLRKKRKSFDGEVSLSGSLGTSPERGLISDLVIRKNDNKGAFGSCKGKSRTNYKGKSEVYGGSFVFPSSSDDCSNGETVNVGRVGKKRSQLGLSHAKSHFWATIYGTLKQVIPRSTKCKKDA